MLRLRACLAVPFVLAMTWSGVASANGRFPAANQLVASRTDPSFYVLRTTFGILFSHDKGTTWDWICETAVGYGGAVDPAMGITQTGIIAGIFEGISVSQDQGCTWTFPSKLGVADVVTRFDDPHGAYAVTDPYVAAGDAGESLFQAELYATKDDGKSWARVGAALDSDLLIETVEIAKSDPHRIYISGKNEAPDLDAGPDGGTVTTFQVLVSTDDGQHFTTYTVPAEPRTERGLFISAVDPTNADRVYARVQTVNGTRFIVSDDGAKTFRNILTSQGDLLGFALSEDGSKVYIGGPLDGVQVASRDDLKFTKTSDIQVQCLTMIGTTLWACSNEASGFVLGTSEDDGATFRPRMHLGCMRGPLACPAGSTASQCEEQYDALAQSLAVGINCAVPGEDAGAAGDASTPMDASSSGGGGGGGSGCSCTAIPGGPSALGGMVAGLAGAVALVARKKRRRS